MIPTEIEIAKPIVQHYEGLVLTPYICPADYLTVGYGHLTHSRDPITAPTAIRYLHNDLAISYKQLIAYTKPEALYAMQPYQRAALISFIFNLGIGNYNASTLKRCVNRQDWQGAVGELPKWRRGGSKILNGLVVRRATEALLFDTGNTHIFNNVSDIPCKYKI